MTERLPMIRFERNEWRVSRGGSLLFRARSERDARAWIAAHYLPLGAAQSRAQLAQ